MNLWKSLGFRDQALRAEIPNFAIAAWLAIFPILAVFTAAGLVIGTSQGTEIVESLSTAWAVTRFLSAAAYLCFVAGTTAAAALALDRVNNGSSSFRYVPWWVLGASLSTAVPVFFAHVISLAPALIVLTITLVLPPFLLVLYDRTLIPFVDLVGERLVWFAALILACVGFILLAAVLLSPVSLPRTLGPVGIVYSGFGFWALVWTILFVRLPRRFGLPTLTLPVALLVIIFANFNDNHGLRVCQTFDYSYQPGDAVAVINLTREHRLAVPFCSGQLDRASQSRLPPRPLSFDAHVRRWLKRNCHLKDTSYPRQCPMIFVAAEGGGSRAAYWTAAVLSHLDSQTQNNQFFHHIFAISGVSGGSLGAAAFVGAYTRNVPSRDQRLLSFVGDDFLSPILAGLLFQETLQRFWPRAVAQFDRALPFELSLEDSWRHFFGDDAFHNDMRTLWPPGTEETAPALFLNSTNVERGVPFVVSNMLPPADTRTESYFAYDPKALYHIDYLPTSAAVHLSARFSYVNPPATLYSRPSTAAVFTRKPESAPRPKGFLEVLPWGRLVDGGYYDNSGASTLQDVLLATKRAVDVWRAEQPRDAIEPEYLVLIIQNDPDLAGATDSGPPGRTLSRSVFVASTIPQRPRELPEPYLYTIHNLTSTDYGADKPPASWFSDRNLLLPDRFQRMLNGSETWKKHAAESDFVSPVDAFFQARGGGSLGARLALSSLAAQLDVETIQRCYRRLYSGLSGDPGANIADARNRGKLYPFLRCVPDEDYVALEDCTDTTPNSRYDRDLRFGAILRLARTGDTGLACRVPMAWEDIAFGEIEEERAEAVSSTLLDRETKAAFARANPSPGRSLAIPAGQSADLPAAYAAPALGWSLSKESKAILDLDASLIPQRELDDRTRPYDPSTTVARVNDYIATAPCTMAIQELAEFDDIDPALRSVLPQRGSNCSNDLREPAWCAWASEEQRSSDGPTRLWCTQNRRTRR